MLKREKLELVEGKPGVQFDSGLVRKLNFPTVKIETIAWVCVGVCILCKTDSIGPYQIEMGLV